MKWKLPLSKFALESILNVEPNTKHEMLLVISSYLIDSGHTAEIHTPEAMAHYLRRDKQIANNFCVAKRWYFKNGVVNNVAPLEKLHQEDLEERNYYWNEDGDMFIYIDGAFEEVALERKEYVMKKDFLKIYPESLVHHKKVKLLKGAEHTACPFNP